jgi:hypothetical protein
MAQMNEVIRTQSPTQAARLDEVTEKRVLQISRLAADGLE